MVDVWVCVETGIALCGMIVYGLVGEWIAVFWSFACFCYVGPHAFGLVAGH